MRKMLFLFFAIIITLRLSAQVSLSVQAPAGGLVPIDQLWNLTLMNNSGAALNVYLKLSVRDAVSNVELLSGKSREFFIEPGIRPVFSQDVQPVLYNYTSQDFSRSFLPLGAYVSCYELVMTELKETPVTQECIQLNIDPLSPPLLNSPPDQAEIQNPYPQLTWIPPTPFIMFSRMNYDLVVTEVMPGQEPADAIQQNMPVYTRSNLSQPFEYLASATRALQLNKLYAWQVLARNASNYAAKTEVWTFSLKDNQPETDQYPGDHYFILDEVGNGIHHVSGEKLKLRFYSTATIYQAQINFYDARGKKIRSLRQTITPGNNYLDLKLNHSFDKGQVFKCSLVDHEAVAHHLSFKMQ